MKKDPFGSYTLNIPKEEEVQKWGPQKELNKFQRAAKIPQD